MWLLSKASAWIIRELSKCKTKKEREDSLFILALSIGLLVAFLFGLLTASKVVFGVTVFSVYMLVGTWIGWLLYNHDKNMTNKTSANNDEKYQK